MFVTNGNTKNLGNGAGADPKHDLPAPLPWVVRLLQGLRRIKPSHLPVASKLALSISITLTVIMALLGAVIVQDQTKHFRNQITLQGTTMVQTLSKAMGEQITLAQIPVAKPGSTSAAIDKADPLLTLKVMTTQINTSQGILGAAVYSADGKILTREGNFPFQRGAPYANQEKRFLDNHCIFSNGAGTTPKPAILMPSRLSVQSNFRIPWLGICSSPLITRNYNVPFALLPNRLSSPLC